jgi:hypothetical protein
MDFCEAARVLDPRPAPPRDGHRAARVGRAARRGAQGRPIGGRHAYDEMSVLARFLPSLYVAENRVTERPALPWEA